MALRLKQEWVKERHSEATSCNMKKLTTGMKMPKMPSMGKVSSVATSRPFKQGGQQAKLAKNVSMGKGSTLR